MGVDPVVLPSLEVRTAASELCSTCKIAELGVKAAKNDLIGYDQGQRDTYWQHLKASNYDPSQITIACEADCSAGVIANVKAVGHLLNIDSLKNLKATYTGDMRSAFRAAGFTVLTDKKYLNGPDYLLAGDILLNDGLHTATNIADGAEAGGNSTNTDPAATVPETTFLMARNG